MKYKLNFERYSMPLEIERKFLVSGDGWRNGEGIRCIQGYLNTDKERTVRVRLGGDKAFLTIKGLTTGATREEYEYEIPTAHAQDLLKLCEGPLIEKIRYKIACDGLIWEIYEFLGENAGLILAEVELQKENQVFERPSWLGEEVTHDERYFNSNLCSYPYSKWPKGKK